MRILLATVLVLGMGLPGAGLAQTPGTQAPAAKSAPATTPRTKREPTAGQLAARERQKRCGVQWREAKAKGETGGLKWPQYWSKCNARLKGGGQA